MGPRARRLIQRFWEFGEMACRASGYYGRVFRADRGVTQGGALSPKVFNLMVDAIVREWITQLEERGVDMEDIRNLVACFYADDGLVAARDADTLQKAFDILTGLFDRVGLRTNTTKTEVMICVAGRIRTPLDQDAYEARMSDLHRAERKGRKVEFPTCGETLAVGSLRSHLTSQHDQ